ITGPTSASGNTGDSDPITFGRLQPGDYTVQATATGLTQKPPPLVVRVDLDTSRAMTVLMTRDSPAKAPLRGRVVFDDNGTPSPLRFAFVTVPGTTYPPSSPPPPPFNAIRSTTTAIPIAPDGTFTVDTTRFDFALGDVHIFPIPGFPPSFVDQTFVNR